MISLKQSANSGIKWSLTSQFSRQGMQFATTIILARLLAPSDFGLKGMAMVVIGFVFLFKDLGTSAAIIQRKHLSEEFLSSIFWVNVVFGFFATGVLFMSAPVIASFYREPRVTPILGVLSLTFLISGFSILHQAILQRNLAFNKLAKVEIGSIIAGSVIGIGAALLGAGVWSLVYQTLAVAAMTTILLWTSSSWRPKLVFHWTEVKSVSSYSLNLTGFNIFNYFSRNADNLLIGRFLGAQALGYYALAYRIMLLPLQNISYMVGRVMFPVYSQIQDDDSRFRRVYLKAASAIALVTFPLMLGLMGASKLFVLTVFGAQWAPVILLLIVLAPVGLIQSISTTAGSIYQAKGYTNWMLRWGLVSGSLTVIAFAVGLQWGVVGVAVAYAITSITLTPPTFAIPFRLINLRLRDLGFVLWRPFLNSSLMLIVLLSLRSVLPIDLPEELALAVLVPAGAVTYLLASWMIDRSHVRQVLDMAGMRV
ncbi:MAG: MOP flippase family protein [Actinobacteria bacterium]|nr:MOP flippase family protein [Actinomycetota bacterium]